MASATGGRFPRCWSADPSARALESLRSDCGHAWETSAYSPTHGDAGGFLYLQHVAGECV